MDGAFFRLASNKQNLGHVAGGVKVFNWNRSMTRVTLTRAGPSSAPC